jgi:hypothetical protein
MTMATHNENRYQELVQRWRDNWNDNLEAMIDESYAPDCECVNMLTGVAYHGRGELRKVEHAMLNLDASRRMEIQSMVVVGNKVALQVYFYWNDTPTNGAVFLTFNAKGEIQTDNTYAQDPTGASTPGSKNFVPSLAS